MENQYAFFGDLSGTPWKGLESIELVDLQRNLDGNFCYQKGTEACGANNNYVIPLPISKYYNRSTLTVAFHKAARHDIVVESCGYYSLDEGCLKSGTASDLKFHDGQYSVELPVSNAGMLQVRVYAPETPDAPGTPPMTDICQEQYEHQRKFYTYTMIIGRACDNPEESFFRLII